MKKCDNCGYENRDAAKFCNDCGAPLAKKSVGGSTPVVCPACGATAVKDAAFCGVCGRKLDDDAPRSAACLECGYVNEKNAVFCGKCGAPLLAENAVRKSSAPTAEPAPAATVQDKTDSAEKPVDSGKTVAVKAKTFEFENKHHVIINSLVAVFAIIVLFVALFAPIKLRFNITVLASNSIWMDSESTYNIEEAEFVEVEQPFWKILAALGYINLDMSDFNDMEKLSDIMGDYYERLEEARSELNDWKHEHPNASAYRTRDKFADILEDCVDDVNILAVLLAATSENYLYYGPKDSPTTKSIRTNVIVTLIQSLITVALCLATAVAALVFMIRAFLGMYNKRTTVKPFKFLGAVLGVSGAGIILSMLSPLAEVNGVMLGLALFTAIVYLIGGAAKSVIIGNGIINTVKRAATALALLVAFFVLCGEAVKITTIIMQEGKKTVQYATLPVGGVLYELISALCIVKYGTSIYISMLSASAVAGVIAIVLGVVLAATAFAAMHKSLKELSADTNGTSGAFVTAIATAVIALLFAILPAAIGAAAKLPMAADIIISTIIKLSVSARAGVYVSLAFAIAAAVLCACFKPKKTESSSVAVQ